VRIISGRNSVELTSASSVRLRDLLVGASVLAGEHSALVRKSTARYKQEHPSNTVGGPDYPVVRTRLSLYVIGLDAKISTNIAEVPVSTGGGGIQVSFLDTSRGWTALSGRLLATGDAGKSWAEVTPGGAPQSLQDRPPARSMSA